MRNSEVRSSLQDPGQFVRERIPVLIAKKRQLQIVFVTHREVGGREGYREYPNGYVAMPHPGLTIKVQTCETSDALAEQFLAEATRENPNDPRLFERVYDRVTADALRVLEHRMRTRGIIERATETIIVLYAGLSGFRESLAFAERFRQDGGDRLRVILVTCDCELWQKRPDLERACASGVLDEALMAKHCGAREDLAMILEGFVEAWPTFAGSM